MGYCRRMGVCFQEMLADEGSHGTVSPLSAPPPARPSSLSTFRPGIAVVVIVLAVTFSLTFLLLLYAKHCKRGAGGDEGNGGGAAAFSSSAARRRNSGVSRAVVEALPVFRFGALTGSHKDGLECAVCIARFEPEEVLRLLPKCHHAFHVECVDTWLDAHSTCPLCRSRVDPEDILLLPDREALPPDDSKDGGDDSDPQPVVGRRVSGRHSSAGERSSDPLKVAGHRGRSVDSAAGCVEWGRKDGILLGEREGIERRCGHRIVISGHGEGWQERWSDLRPSEILFLKSEMIMSGEDRRSVSRDTSAISSSARCASETRGVSRFAGGHRRRAEEERAMRKWLSFEGSRTARWPGSRGSEDGPDG